MKKLLLFATMLLCLAACKPQGFTVNGTINGDNVNGNAVLSCFDLSGNETTIAESPVKDGKFLFKGSVESPVLVRVTADLNTVAREDSTYDYSKLLFHDFYLENSDITYTADLATHPAMTYDESRKEVKPVVKGSATQDLYDEYKDQCKNINAELSVLDTRYSNEYLIPYFDHTGDPAEVEKVGMEIAKKTNELNDSLDVIKEAFIIKHPESVVSQDLFIFPFQMSVSMTSEQLKKEYSALEPFMKKRSDYAQIDTLVRRVEKLAMGEKCPDVMFQNLNGEQVSLHSLIPEGKLVMLEFWASWCGPCRGEIPHLRDIYAKYKDKNFEVISVSVDDSEENWKKAVSEENMSWIQLRDTAGFSLNSTAYKVFNVSGVPSCTMLDEQGRFLKVNMRGAYLDLFMKEHYGF